MLAEILRATRESGPLVHCITNYVTANDCANLLLACGASPIMADDPAESAEVTRACSALVLNLGTPSPRRIEAMLASGREANALGLPVVFDPVGVGCSALRTDAAKRLMDSVRFAIIRGNASEIAALVGTSRAGRGVDAGEQHSDAADAARRLARLSGAAVALTGQTDIVTDGAAEYRVHNGHPIMRRITGAGCQLSTLAGAFAGAAPDRPLTAALAATCAMGLCGETAHARMSPRDGNASCRTYLIDAMYNLTPQALEEGAKYEF